MSAVAATGLLGFAVLAGIHDLRTRRIPNRLSALFLAAALVVASTPAGIGLAPALGGAALGLVVLFVPFTAGALGGGDVKFAIVAGAWLGPRAGLEALLLGSAAGLVIGLAWALRAGALGATLASSARLLWLTAATLSPTAGAPARPEASPLAPVPYAVPLALGVALTVALELGGAPLF